MSHLLSCCESILGVTVESVQGNQVYLEWTRTSVSFGKMAGPLEVLSIFNLKALPLEVRRECRDSFLDESGKWTLISILGGITGPPYELWQDPRCSSRLETGMSRNFLSCLNGVKTLSRLRREGGISLEPPPWKKASSHVEDRISWFFSSCGRKLGVPLKLHWGHQGPARVASGK